MKNPALFFGGIILALLGIGLGIDYLIPNTPHLLASDIRHITHATACFVLAALGILVALINRPKAA